MKDIIKINDILNSIKQVRNYQERAELNLAIDSLLSKFLPDNLKQDVKAFSLESGLLTLILNSSTSKANFIFWFAVKSDLAGHRKSQKNCD